MRGLKQAAAKASKEVFWVDRTGWSWTERLERCCSRSSATSRHITCIPLLFLPLPHTANRSVVSILILYSTTSLVTTSLHYISASYLRYICNGKIPSSTDRILSLYSMTAGACPG